MPAKYPVPHHEEAVDLVTRFCTGFTLDEEDLLRELAKLWGVIPNYEKKEGEQMRTISAGRSKPHILYCEGAWLVWYRGAFGVGPDLRAAWDDFIKGVGNRAVVKEWRERHDA